MHQVLDRPGHRLGQSGHHEMEQAQTMKTKPTKKAVEAVLDELYPLIREVKIQEEPTRTPPHRDWRDQPKWVRSMWQTIARWHLSKLNARKP